MSRSIRILLLLFFTSVVACYPIAEDMDNKSDIEYHDEKTFPNGSVIGKYSYSDSEGNPIHVKYYADDQGYGVELSSVKIVKAGDQKSSVANKPAKTEYQKLGPTLEVYKYPNNVKKMVHEPMDLLSKESTKSHLKNKYKSHDYEVYLQKELPSPKCGGDVEKVKIYNFEKNKNTRNVLNGIQVEEEPEDADVETPKFCERY